MRLRSKYYEDTNCQSPAWSSPRTTSSSFLRPKIAPSSNVSRWLFSPSKHRESSDRRSLRWLQQVDRRVLSLGDVGSGKRLHTIPGGRKGTTEEGVGHTGHILCMTISSDGKYLVNTLKRLISLLITVAATKNIPPIFFFFVVYTLNQTRFLSLGFND